MTKDFNNIKDWLIPILDKKGWSVEEFGRKLGLTRAAVYHYLNDSRRPTEERMSQICKVLGVPLSEGMAQFTPRTLGRPRGY